VWAIVAAAVPALAALGVLTATGFLPAAEVRALLRRSVATRA
jgi:hypothetical protein